MRRLWLIAAVVFGCTPDLHERCDDGQACPNGFYCDGVWCFPDGVGPVLGDDVGPRVDATIDQGRDASPPDMRADMAGDMLPGDMLPGDMLPGDMLPGDMLPGDSGRDRGMMDPLVIGDVRPTDSIVSSLAGPARDTIRVALRNANAVAFAVTADGESPCTFGDPVDVSDGTLVIPAARWAAFAPDGQFHVCVRRGMGREHRLGPFTVDDVPPRLAALQRIPDRDLGVRFVLTADEPLTEARVFTDPTCRADALEARFDGEGREVEVDVLDRVPDVLGVELTDVIGNPRACFPIRIYTLDCHDGGPFASGDDGVERGEVTLLERSCGQIRPDGPQLVGDCVACTLFLGAELPDGAIGYDHVRVRQRRGNFSGPHPFPIVPGALVQTTIDDVARVNDRQIAFVSSVGVTTWTRAADRWQHRARGVALDGPVVTAADLSGNGTTSIVVGNYEQPGDVRRLGPDLVAVGQPHEEGDRLVDLLRFNPTGRNGDRVIALDTEGRLLQYTQNGNGFDAVALARDVGLVAPLPVGDGQGVALWGNFGDLTAIGVLLDGAPVLHTLLETRPNCLATGDWDNDGQADIIACVDGGLEIFALDPDGAPAPLRNTALRGLSGAPLVDAVVGYADFDTRADALVVDAAGRLILVTNQDGAPTRFIDLPFLHPRLRDLQPPPQGFAGPAPLDIGILHPSAPRMGRLVAFNGADHTPRIHRLRVDGDEQLVGLGDVDGDHIDDALLFSPNRQRFRVLAGGPDGPGESLMLQPGGRTNGAAAVTLADVNGDGMADVVAHHQGELSLWRGGQGRNLPQYSELRVLDGAIRLRRADWIADGFDEVLLGAGQTLQHLGLAPIMDGMGFISHGLGGFEDLVDFTVADVEPDPGLELTLVTREAGDADLLVRRFTLDQFADAPELRGAELLAAETVHLSTAALAGAPRLLRRIDYGDQAEVVLGDDDSTYLGPIRDVTAGDLDGDGQTELVLLHGGDAPGLQYVMRAADGVVVDGAFDPEVEGSQVFIGDIDGDGRREIVVVERGE